MSQTSTKGGRRARPKVRLAEEPGPPQELEAAIEAREDQLFVEAVRRAKPGLTQEEAGILARAARERPVRKVRRGESGEEYAHVAPDMRWLGAQAGMLGEADLREMAQELRARLPGHAHGYGPSLPPDAPTDAAPGSEEKILVMQGRLRNRQALHHPADRTLPAGVFASGLLSRAGG